MPDVKRTTAEVDREARIRGDLLRAHADVETRIRVAPFAEKLFFVQLEVEGYERTVARAMHGTDARAVACALALVLKCPVDTEAVDQ